MTGKPIFWIIILLVVGLVGGCLIYPIFHVERRDLCFIEGRLFEKIPVGSSKRTLVEFLESKSYAYRDYGTSVEAILAEYFSLPLFVTTVVAEWFISSSNTVTYLEVRRYRDGP